MRRLAVALSASGVLLLAAWIQAPSAAVRDIAAPSVAEVASADQAAQSMGPVTRQIDEEAERLRQRLAAQVPFSEPARDPFRFNARPVPAAPTPKARTVAAMPAVVEPVMNPPAPPTIAMPVLIGLTEDSVAGVVTRTAVLSMGDEMAIVKVGATFSRFVVQSIGATSVELVDVTSPTRAVSVIAIR